MRIICSKQGWTGEIVLAKINRPVRPYAVWTRGCDGRFHHGDYLQTFEAAKAVFRKRKF